MSIWRLLQAYVPFYSHVQVFFVYIGSILWLKKHIYYI